jgi:hypothetical protein
MSEIAGVVQYEVNMLIAADYPLQDHQKQKSIKARNMKYPYLFIMLPMTLITLSCNDADNDTPKVDSIGRKADSECDHKAIESVFITMDMDSLINLSLQNDTSAYNDLMVKFALQHEDERAFYYSLLVANKFNNPRAHFEVYASLAYSCHFNGKEWLISSDEKTRNLALCHLYQSKVLGYRHAKYHIDEAQKQFGDISCACK